MDKKDEIKIEQINLRDKNKKYPHERNNITNKMIGITGSNIHLNFVSEEKNIDKLDNETTLLNNYKENKTISDTDNNVEIYFNNIQKRRQEEEEKEQKLIFFYHKLTGSYKNKNYQNIVREIENLKVLFRHSSEISLKLYILKMRCLLKTIKEQYYKLIIVNDQKINLTEIMKKIYKIKREFESLTDYINPYNLSNYEDIIQIYSKFLLYLSIVCKLREEYLKGMSYTTMGVNLMKIFFIRKKVAKSIKTYIIYCQLLLMLINSLIVKKYIN